VAIGSLVHGIGLFSRRAHGTRPALQCPMSDLSVLIEEAAKLLGVSRRTIYYRIHEGKLRTIRTRCGSQRVLLSSIEALRREASERQRRRRGEPAPEEDDRLQSESLAF
jgi:excisionase family DNA binding protein